MWSIGRRRSSSTSPVILPSLDRLSTLIERVVELVDAVGSTRVPAPEPVPEGAREAEPAPAVEEQWLAFVPSPHGYRLVERDGELPAPGEVVELDDGPYRVLRIAPSPLPRDRRRCAHVEREEPPEETRTFDA